MPAGGTARVDMARLTAMGHSMGSTIGIPVATVDPRIKGYVFSGAGGLLIEVATETTYPVNLRTTLELLLGFKTGETLDRNHPLLHAFQSLWDSIDPSAKARHVAREPYPGQVPKPYFLPQGLIDGYFHPGAQTAVGGALGTTLIGEELDPTLPRTLRLDGQGTTHGVSAAQQPERRHRGHGANADTVRAGALHRVRRGLGERPGRLLPRERGDSGGACHRLTARHRRRLRLIESVSPLPDPLPLGGEGDRIRSAR